MTWDYRVIKQEHPTGTTYAIYEVYYDDEGNILYISKDPENPQGETLTELKNDLKYMRQALKRPILDMDEVLKLISAASPAEFENPNYTYRITWSEEDNQYVGLCAEFPSLSWLADSQEAALLGILKLVREVDADMAEEQ
jgi:hypothetical protein